MSADLNSFFNPTSIAIIGVSHEPQKVGYIVAKNILDQGYKGKLFFINPHLETVLDHKVYKSLSEVNEKIELVILAVPAEVAMSLLTEVNTLGIKNVLIYAAGFKEMPGGKEKEEALIKLAHEYGINVLGPNCLGYINTSKQINATFLGHVSPVGNISVVSQSGALGSILIDYLVDHVNLGLSYFISLGNKTVLDESDCLEYLANDPNTQVIGMYLEDVRDGERFRKTLMKVTAIKPVVILKSGSSTEGAKAAVSHTGGLVGDAEVYSAIFRQAGAVHATSYDQFLNTLRMYSFARVPTSSSILVLSNAGGIGVLLTDELMKHNLTMITVSEHIKREIEKTRETEGLKPITLHNPIDLLGDASAFDYRQVILSSIQQQDIGAVIVLLTPQANTQILETAKVITQAQNHFIKPIYPVFMGEQSIIDAHTYFEQNRIVSFENYDNIPTIIRGILDSYEFQGKEVSSHTPESLGVLAHESQIKDKILLSQNKTVLNLEDSLTVLHLSGVPVLPVHHAHHSEEISHIAKKVHFPVVAKVASDAISHKTEVKGVITGIESLEDLQAAYESLSEIAKEEGCYIQKMVKGQELFIGAKRDEKFGPVVIFGLGGIYVELLQEVSQFVFPFSLDEFSHVIANTKVMSLVKGFRGAPPINIKSLHSAGMTLGFLLSRFEEIQSIDINPFFATEKGVFAADSRIALK